MALSPRAFLKNDEKKEFGQIGNQDKSTHGSSSQA